jgi:hypothetical protein
VARRDAGSSRADRPAPRPHIALPRDREYTAANFEPVPGAAREYRLRGSDTVVSKRERDQALRGFISNEFAALRNKPAELDYQDALRAFTENHASTYGDPTTQEARQRAERSAHWQLTWRAIQEPPVLDTGADGRRHYRLIRQWERKQAAARAIFGEHPDRGDRMLWRTLVSPPQPSVPEKGAA